MRMRKKHIPYNLTGASYWVEKSCNIQATGSLLLSSSPEETRQLQQRAQLLQSVGEDCRFLDHDELLVEEPALDPEHADAALLTRGDGQIVRTR